MNNDNDNKENYNYDNVAVIKALRGRSKNGDVVVVYPDLKEVT